MNYLKLVEDFHKVFDHPVLDEPKVDISKERQKLRVNLLEEEVKELKEALEKGDKVEVLDALCDIQYVLSGAILEFGLKVPFHKAFAQVHRSNMSKACNSLEEANKTIDNYVELGKISKREDAKIRPKTWFNDIIFTVRRVSDDKILKSINYTPVDLSKFV